jgi:hypothetical protein
MINIYKYCYYKIFSFGTKRLSWPAPYITSLVLFITPISLIILTIYRILLINKILIDLDLRYFEFGILLMAILIIPNYFYFVWNQRYLKIEKTFENESKFQQMIGSSLVLLYFIGTFIVFIIVAAIPIHGLQ